MFLKLEQEKNSILFRLGVKNSHGAGARLGFDKKRHLKNACWHAHGHFFEKLFEICPDAVIYSL